MEVRATAVLPRIALALMFAGCAGATTWTVNTLNDSHDVNCGSVCSLRDAIMAANAGSGNDTIVFNVSGTILVSTSLVLTKAMTIQGPPLGITVTGTEGMPFVFETNATSGTMAISNMTISTASSSPVADISNTGSLVLTGITLPDYGILTFQGSVLKVINCTFLIGGIDNMGPLTVANSTFAGNGIQNPVPPFGSRPVAVTNTIFAGIGGINTTATISEEYNLFSSGTANIGFSPSATDVVGQDPLLLPLGNYGGPAPTMLPQIGSPAICAGSPSGVPAGTNTDQRGFPLNAANCANGGVDIGAVQTLYQFVSTTDDSGSGSLRNAITQANAAGGGDIAFTTTGTIALASALPTVTGSVFINGPGSSNLTIDGVNQFQILDVASSASAWIVGLTIADGFSAMGNGCGLNNQGLADLTGSVFSGNACPLPGGAIYNSGSMALTNTTFTANSSTAADGGAIYNDQGTLSIAAGTFSGNSSALDGGAIANQGTLSVVNSTFSGNSSTGDGGGIANQGTLSVAASTFLNNTANHDGGGGIYNLGGGATITNTTFSGNAAPGQNGGGVYNDQGGSLTVAGATFWENSCQVEGGGIFSNGMSTLSLTNSIFSGNTAQLLPAGGVSSSGSTSESYNVFFNGNRDVRGFTPSPNDLFADPILSAPGNYGGSTLTMLPLPGSAAICAGASMPGAATTDQRGAPRTTAYPSLNLPCLDIGAVQSNYQSIQFTNAADGYSGLANQAVTPAPNVTVTENGQNRDGVPVTLTISGSPAAGGLTATTGGGNGATFSNLSVSASGDYTLSATLNLNPALYSSLSITTNPTADLTINPNTASVAISNIPTSASFAGSFTPAYSVTPADDNGATSVSSLTANTCTVSGATVNFTGAGTCTLQAAIAATSVYQAATGSSQSFNIGQAIAAVSISNIPASAAVGGSFTPLYGVTPSGDTGTASVTSLTTATCTVAGGTVSFVGRGTCTLQASVAATANCTAATGSQQSFNIAKETATVSISNIPATAAIGGSFTPAYTVTPSGDTAAASVASLTTATCTASSGTVQFIAAGTCTLQASLAATANDTAAVGARQSFQIAKESATVSISNLPASAIIGSSFKPVYTVTPGDTGRTSVISLTTATCTVTAGKVSFVGVGACTVQASVAATATYSAALGASQNLSVTYKVVAVYKQNSPVQSGRVLPIKVQLTNSSGGNLSASGITLTVGDVSPSPAPGPQPNGAFTFVAIGASSPLYQYNLTTTGYPSGTYTFSFSVSGDPMVHTVSFEIQ